MSEQAKREFLEVMETMRRDGFEPYAIELVVGELPMIRGHAVDKPVAEYYYLPPSSLSLEMGWIQEQLEKGGC